MLQAKKHPLYRNIVMKEGLCGQAAFDPFTEPVERFLNCTVEPNDVTFVRAVILLYALILTPDTNVSAVLPLGMLLIAVWMDSLDGCVARMCNKASRLGAYLDVGVDGASFVGAIALVAWGYKENRVRLEEIKCLALIYVASALSCLTLDRELPFFQGHRLPRALAPWLESINSVLVFAFFAYLVYAFSRKDDKRDGVTLAV